MKDPRKPVCIQIDENLRARAREKFSYNRKRNSGSAERINENKQWVLRVERTRYIFSEFN